MKQTAHRSSIVEWLAVIAIALSGLPTLGQVVEQAANEAIHAPGIAEEISLDLIVHDKKDKPVLDLKPGEIEVTDNGSPVTLSDLHLVTGKQEFEHPVTLIFDRPVQAAGVTANADPFTMQIVRTAAAKILNWFPETGFQFSVLNVEGRLRMQVGFTSDRKALEQAVIAATEPDNSPAGSAVSPAEKEVISEALTGVDGAGKAVSARERTLARALYSALNNAGHIAQDQHLRPSLAALLALAQSEPASTQTSDVIYFTSMKDRQVDSRAREAIQSIIGTANHAGMRIYVVDMNALDRMGAQRSAQDALDLPPEQLQARGLTAVAKETINNDMERLAEETGASYITGDRLRKSTDAMIEDMGTYYVASYRSPHPEPDGKFCPVVVKGIRAGIKIRSGRGYLALPPHSGNGDSLQPFELPLLKVFSGAELPVDVPFRAAILRRGDLAGGNGNTLAIEVPLSSLDLHQDSNTGVYAAHISIVADVKDKTGAVVEHISSDIPRRGMLKDAAMAEFEAITLQRYFVAQPGAYFMEAAVLDCNSNKIGAQRIPFEIPAAESGLSVNSMVLVRKTEPANASDDPADSLRHGDDKVIPNLSGQLAPGVTNVSVFFIAHTNPGNVDAATLKAEVFREGKLLGSAPLVTHKADASEFSSYLAGFSIDPPMDGVYEIKAVLSEGGVTTEASAAFTMVGRGLGESDSASSEANAPALETLARPAGPLAITQPANPIQRPSADELDSIIADARRNVMAYRDSLPNFICERVTDRSIDQDGTGVWKHKDKFTELLTYFDREESRNLLQIDVDGHRLHDATDDTEDAKGVQSAGEFGAVMTGLFRPSSKAEFKWKETDMLAEGTVQVFDYRVEQENSTLNIRTSSNEVVKVGFHGQVVIDSATRNVRRISQVVDTVPKGFPVHATLVSVDYDYVAINNHDYLLPVGAQIILRRGRREADMNEIEFRNFRRFGSTLRILNDAPALNK
jgi:VWFA-related protein